MVAHTLGEKTSVIFLSSAYIVMATGWVTFGRNEGELGCGSSYSWRENFCLHFPELSIYRNGKGLGYFLEKRGRVGLWRLILLERKFLLSFS